MKPPFQGAAPSRFFFHFHLLGCFVEAFLSFLYNAPWSSPSSKVLPGSRHSSISSLGAIPLLHLTRLVGDNNNSHWLGMAFHGRIASIADASYRHYALFAPTRNSDASAHRCIASLYIFPCLSLKCWTFLTCLASTHCSYAMFYARLVLRPLELSFGSSISKRFPSRLVLSQLGLSFGTSQQFLPFYSSRRPVLCL